MSLPYCPHCDYHLIRVDSDLVCPHCCFYREDELDRRTEVEEHKQKVEDEDKR